MVHQLARSPHATMCPVSAIIPPHIPDTATSLLKASWLRLNCHASNQEEFSIKDAEAHKVAIYGNSGHSPDSLVDAPPHQQAGARAQHLKGIPPQVFAIAYPITTLNLSQCPLKSSSSPLTPV
jgi:hypothetical protein